MQSPAEELRASSLGGEPWRELLCRDVWELLLQALLGLSCSSTAQSREALVSCTNEGTVE